MKPQDNKSLNFRTRAGRLVASVLVAGLALAGCTDSGFNTNVVAQPAVPRSTTVLVYLNATNLESGISGNLKQMLAAQTPSDAQFVICTGGSGDRTPDSPVSSWKTVKRQVIQSQKLTELEDLGPQSMDDPAVLRDFIVWGAKNYPAQRYLLFMSDHGDAYRGFGGDGVNHPPSGATHISQPDLIASIGEASRIISSKFDLIGFDACLMASQEVSHGLAPYANYLLASEELEPGIGWNWTPLVQSLANDSKIPAPKLGRTVADAYIAQFQASTRKVEPKSTLSVLDLSQEERLAKALTDLSAKLNRAFLTGDEDTIEKFVAARFKSYDFGVATETVDLIDLAKNLQAQNLFPTETAALASAAKSEVVYSKTGELATGANGIAVFIPRTVLSTNLPSTYASVDFLQIHKDLVGSIFTWANAQVSSIRFSNTLYDVARSVISTTVDSRFGIDTLDIAISANPPASNQIEFVQTYPSDSNFMKTIQPLNVSAPVSTQSLTWDGHRIAATPDANSKTATKQEYNIYATVNGEQAVITIVKDSSSVPATFQIVNYFAIEAFDRDDPISPTDLIQPLATGFNRSTGRTDEVPLGSPFLAGTMSITEQPLPSGQFYLYFLLRDLRGGQFLTSDSLPIIVP